MKKLVIGTNVPQAYGSNFEYLTKQPDESDYFIFDFDEEIFDNISENVWDCELEDFQDEYPEIDPEIIEDLYDFLRSYDMIYEVEDLDEENSKELDRVVEDMIDTYNETLEKMNRLKNKINH